MYHADIVGCFHGGLIEAGIRLTCMSRLELGCGNFSVIGIVRKFQYQNLNLNLPNFSLGVLIGAAVQSNQFVLGLAFEDNT